MALQFIKEGEEPTQSTNLVEALGAQARKRLALLALVVGGLIVAGWVLRLVLMALEVEQAAHDPMFDVRPYLQLGQFALCAMLYAYVRSGKGSPGGVINVGLGFEVVVAAVIAVGAYYEPTSKSLVTPTWLTVWIVLFPLVVPAQPGKHLVASLLAASMAPLAYAIGPRFEGTELGFALIPNLSAVALAFLLARVMHRIEEEVHEAKQEAKQMGSYKLVKKLGEGGMGEVWSARHSMLRRKAAVKLILPDAVDDEALARFKQEAQVTSSLESPHTISLYDFGVTDDGTFYYVMELLRGVDLEELIVKNGPLSPERTVYLLRQACRSLEEAHARGLIHRDIKPANLFACRVAEQVDYIKVLDFGLVKKSSVSNEARRSVGLTAEGIVLGTPTTMAPEQVMGEAIDARCDIYALGCVAYYLLSGKLIFEAKTGLEMCMAHVNDPPIPLSTAADQSIPEDLEALIMSCLAKSPVDRPETATELAFRLRECSGVRHWSQRLAREWWREHLTDVLV